MNTGGGSSEPCKKDVESAESIESPVSSTGKSNTIIQLNTSSKGVENAKKRLRAFSIQKKTSLAPIIVPKATSNSNTTVIIGKLTGVKVTPKAEPDPEQKKLKPPKPGSSKRSVQDSYTELQKRTLSEIEDMKRKMELVELGIPLGLICPTSTSEKAMPTKAMPPIKSFLDPSKVDDLIREAKKAKQEGREYKFNYQKLLPGYDNPFQKKKEEPSTSTYEKERRFERRRSESGREREKDGRRSDKYDMKRHDKRDAKHRDREKDRRHDKLQRDNSDEKETDVNLNDYLVCDSWSLENDDKNSTSSPKVLDKPSNNAPTIPAQVPEQKTPLLATAEKNEIFKTCAIDSPKNVPIKIEKLQPVMDSFKYEIDPNNDEILDIFDEDSNLDRYAQQTKAKHRTLYDSPDKSVVRYEQDSAKDSSMDGLNDDTFLESVINEIKQETLSDESSQDKGLVEYELSPNREESPEIGKRCSITPELDEKIISQSQRSDYSEGYRSSESFKSIDTIESGYKSVESFRLSVEKELDDVLEAKMSKSTVDSLEIWSFVLKICQPLLFRHDKNKCYKETRTNPKLWFVENPKACECVKDRGVVYDELEMCKMSLVDRVYGCDQIPDAPFPKTRNWYPRNSLCTATENTPVPLSNEWEAEDSQLADRSDMESTCTTPQRNDEMSLDREYQRFMEAVWPDVVESKTETPRSTTPVRQESRKKKKEETEERKSKKIKLSSEGWSQESDIEEEDKSKKQKIEKKAKSRKRKHSTSTLSSSVSETDEDVRKRKRKLLKKKAIKKAKSKSAKRRRMGRKLLKKLKEKQKKRIKEKNIEEEDDNDKKREKKLRKKKQQKLKKKELKRKKIKAQSSSSSSSSSDSSDSESEDDRKSRKAKKKSLQAKKQVKKLRKQSTSDSTQSFEEDLFDVNILNNIKTERLTDDEKMGHNLMNFSPRRQKPREIIDVKELQNDFVENIHIKQEAIEDTPKPKEVQSNVQKKDQKVPDTEDLESKTNITKDIDLPMLSPQSIQLPPEVPPPPSPAPPAAPSRALPPPDDSNMSQASSQDSVCSVKDGPIFYEKDESHLRPSSQNSNYSFNDVINASQNNLYQKDIKAAIANQNTLYAKEIELNVEQSLYPKEIETISRQSDYNKRIELTTSDNNLYDKDLENENECDDKYVESYEAANYEMYEQMAMAYQSDVASQQRSSGDADAEGTGASETRRIETVVGARPHGEIKCDWRAGDATVAPATPRRDLRPSRWGLKPGEVNIVLTGGGSQYPASEPEEPVYRIQSLANRSDISTGYDEAYMDMYGAADRLQYGDCFSDEVDGDVTSATLALSHLATPNTTRVPGNIQHISPNIVPVLPVCPDPAKETRPSTLDDRINKALQETVLGGIAKEIDGNSSEKEKMAALAPPRALKRVSFADGYKPGQDSDVEEPPTKKRKRSRRAGCAWPCPAGHPDHVPLWDALPPPPPPPGSPPPPAPRAPRALYAVPGFDPTVPLPGFMPPEPPPGLIALH